MKYKGIVKVILAIILFVGGELEIVNGSSDFGMIKVSAASKSHKKTTEPSKKDNKKLVPLKRFSYKISSEKGDYPDLTAHPKAWVDVNIAIQRVYIKDGKKKLYTMYSSTGKDDATPRGTYYIQSEKGEYFYTEPLKLGA